MELGGGAVGDSFKIGSSSIWRNSDAEIFSSSFHQDQEDDEEALKWAAIQKLPTFARLRKGLLATPDGKANEIDIHKLGIQEKKILLERLVRIAEEDNEKFLLKLRERIDRVGIDLPTIEVRFEHLNIEAEAHVGSRALPTFTNFMVNIVEGLLNSLHVLPSRRQHINILQDVSGILKPARYSAKILTLLLGPPSSGKTTLLLALAGKLDPKLKVTGKVTYNGHRMNEFVHQRTAAYVSQNDLHIGEMTVRETLAFSARCQGVGARYDMIAELSRREKELNIKPDPDIDVYMKAVAIEGQKANLITDYVLRILGLEICADTFVGNAMIRGISGGQRKRVTTGEMIVGPAKVLFMDEISTGLDSSTTFQIVNSLKQYVHILKGTGIISLLQPAPETYDLFDDIILLSDSHIVYQGPRENVLEFFESMGFKCPGRKGVADFLQEVTSKKDQEQYWAQRDQPYRYITSEEISEAFKSFHVGRSIGDELSTEFDKSKSHPAALTTKMYGVGKLELLKACLSREYLLMKRNSFVYIFKLCQLAVSAMIAMTIFLRTEMHRDSVTHGGVYSGVLFYDVIVILFNGMPEISMVVSRLPVFYKQREYLFFPSWVFALPAWILKIPITIVEVGVWVVLTYYVIGFDPEVERILPTLGKHQTVKSEQTETNEQNDGSKRGINELKHLKKCLSHHSKGEGDGESISGSISLNSSSTREEAAAVETNPNRKRGMVLPFEPHSITFDEVTYAVDMPQHGSDCPRTSMMKPGSDKQQDLFDAMGSMYAAVLLIGVRNSSSVQPVVATERTVFYREKAAGMYSALPYAFAQASILSCANSLLKKCLIRRQNTMKHDLMLSFIPPKKFYLLISCFLMFSSYITDLQQT
ncbi:hypothetical protein RIF29_40140 [Crotalaria pallida]|uniref:ABC transporter domain-containing protein n=1 Tax=Crotalaria pallida TaxID=3830 RepID=A0AAN9E3B7_CROPI